MKQKVYVIEGTEVKFHPVFTNYAVGRLGEIWSKHRGGKWMRPKTLTKDGYITIDLRLVRKPKTVKIHRLVLESFTGQAGQQCNHKNGVKNDNRLSNLEWLTASENTIHAVKTGLKKTKLSLDDIKTIRAAKGQRTLQELADEFGVHYSTISKVWTRKNWAHV